MEANKWKTWIKMVIRIVDELKEKKKKQSAKPGLKLECKVQVVMKWEQNHLLKKKIQ